MAKILPITIDVSINYYESESTSYGEITSSGYARACIDNREISMITGSEISELAQQGYIPILTLCTDCSQYWYDEDAGDWQFGDEYPKAFQTLISFPTGINIQGTNYVACCAVDKIGMLYIDDNGQAVSINAK